MLRLALSLLVVLANVAIVVLPVSGGTSGTAAPRVQAPLQVNEPFPPQYKPRKESTPRARLGGSLRGSEEEAEVVALVPDHVGLTLKAQPALCWYLSKKTSAPVTFTLIDPRTIRPSLETTLSTSEHPGVQCLSLKDHGVSLDHGQQYRWAVTLILDPDQPSGDVVTGGMIERIPFEEGCLLNLPCTWTCEREAVYRYAEAGLWYDAMSCLHELIEAAPDDSTLRKARAALLQQVDLNDIAADDLHHDRTR
ncbi:MAG TPA: DUF928 domain-containing protein [Nitrospiraceae bacterium]|nr:DUF928 domain-containing protein [Nitrospiraceae bacterium]